MSKDDKKHNKNLSENKKRIIKDVKGRINKKHLAIRFVNNMYNLDFRLKDNNIADAIALGTFVFQNCQKCAILT